MVRCFIGILLPESLREDVVKIQKEIEKLPIKCKLVEPENLHLCFSFLGEIPEVQIKMICNVLDSICKNYKSFTVKINGVKLIPNEKFIRVIALDVHGDIASRKLVEEITKEIGGDSKPLHLTLGRVKNVENKNVFLERIKEFKKMEIGVLTISKVQLIKSQLQKTGPVYSVLHESKLF